MTSRVSHNVFIPLTFLGCDSESSVVGCYLNPRERENERGRGGRLIEKDGERERERKTSRQAEEERERERKASRQA